MKILKSLPNNIKSHSNFVGIFGASLLHIPLVIAALEIQNTHIMLPSQEKSEIAFSLAALQTISPVQDSPKSEVASQPQQQVVSTKPVKTPKKKQKKADNKHKSNIEKYSHKSINNSKQSVNTEPTQKTQTLERVGGNTNDPFLIEVANIIAKHQKWSRIALRMRLTGRVIVRMALNAQGQITDLRITHTTAHEILNNQTLSVLKTASMSFPAPNRERILEIPITWRLN
ncbi:hypothetical protein CCZ01_03175 [Helicobacter monodelphidis]|uniref:energy transducer TonB family protein n=1 Tax=Helicobacter sp. 15-1451 TaxID=2004995 RepID=UPI000DCB6F64|nr:energy transducer TonB [Helicobacter sp. 15-1451]RAX58432.1 hypothetical protein CCZ01_03175 [Helicobacter sp. 15-1451]